MKTGKVKWFSSKKGYGFITPDDGESDVFVHYTALESSGVNTLTEGQQVNFEVAKNKGRFSAVHIQLV